MKVRSHILFCLFLFAGCGMGGNSAYNWETHAIYKAVKSDLQVELVSTGLVMAGADLGEGLAKGFMSSPKLKDTIFFLTNSREFLVLETADYKLDTTGLAPTKNVLINFLDSLAYSPYENDEILELREVIMVSTYGPKGTYLDGQTDEIEVIQVDYNTKRISSTQEVD